MPQSATATRRDDMPINIRDVQTSLSISSNYWDYLRAELLTDTEGEDCTFDKHTYNIRSSSLEFPGRIVKTLRRTGFEAKLRGWNEYESYVHVRRNGKRCVIRVYVNQSDMHVVQMNRFDLVIFGQTEMAAAISRELRKELHEEASACVTWWFKSSTSGTQQKTMFLDKPRPISDAMYPWIEGGVRKYFDGYFASDASVLFFIGPPGTGKTSLIRHLICDRKIPAIYTSDEELLQSDELFVYYLSSSDANLLVIEDADLNLVSREQGGNKMMARFLNASEGLVKVPSKKIIFTTNLDSMQRVDQALIRPGRSYGTLEFRSYKPEETSRLVSEFGLPSPANDRPTLAELFNQAHSSPRKQKVGFI